MQTSFLLRLFRVLYQSTDKILVFLNCMVRKQKLLGCIDKVHTLVEQRDGFIKKRIEVYVTYVDSGGLVKTYVWKPMSHRWTVGVRSKRTYVSLFFSREKGNPISTAGVKFDQSI